MIRRLNYYRLCLRITSYLLPLIAFASAWYIRFFFIGEGLGLKSEYDPYSYFSLLLFTTVVWAVAVEHYRIASLDELFRERTGIRAAVAGCSATYMAMFGALFFYRAATFSRIFLLLSAAILMTLTFFIRAAFRGTLRKQTGIKRPIRVLIVGADDYAVRAARRLQRGPFACRIVGYVAVPGQPVAARINVPVYELDRVAEMTIDHGIDDVVIAMDPSRLPQIPTIIRKFDRLCLPVRAIVDLGDGTIVRERLFQFGRLQMLDLVNTPAETFDYSVMKRLFDVGFSAAAILVTAPLMLLIAIAIKLSSTGPVLFVQDRVGLSGRIFRMYKFRTMRVSPPTESDTLWTTQQDDRRTVIGAFLRRTSLDELPQFFNVLLGNMSVVGPRPERPHFVRKFLSDLSQYNTRHRLKVGMTGWAQVNGFRGDTSIQKRLEYDLYYLQNWSIAFDLRIIFMTMFSSVTGKNAY